jgi:hypothetical protein
MHMETLVGLLFKKLVKRNNPAVPYVFVLLHWDRVVNEVTLSTCSLSLSLKLLSVTNFEYENEP